MPASSSLSAHLLALATMAFLVTSCGPQTTISSQASGLEDTAGVISLYRADQPIQNLTSQIQTDATAIETASEQQRLLDEIKALIIAGNVELGADDSLRLTRVTNDAKGMSLRYAQYHKDLPVAGAEALAIFDASGRLRGLNISLVNNLQVASDDAHLNLQDALSAAQEIIERYLGRAAIALPGIENAHQLLISNTAQQGWQKVWRLQIQALQIDVVASGVSAGKIAAHRWSQKSAKPSMKIYNGRWVPLVPLENNKGILVLEDGRETTAAKLARLAKKELVSESILAVQENLQAASQFYQQTFARRSFDNNDATISAVVDLGTGFFSLSGGNASWDDRLKLFAFGIGNEIFDDLGKGADVVGHEFTHAVVSHSSNLEYFSESGALNEHFADVFGEFVQRSIDASSTPFLIGETVVRDGQKPLRSMLNPSEGFVPQPSKMSEIADELRNDCTGIAAPKDNCGVHILSGIPNAAAVKIINAIGWEQAHWLYYRVMTARLLSNSHFVDYRRQMLAECQLQQLGDEACQTVAAALNDAEIIEQP